MEDKLLCKDLTYKIRGILFDIHNELGRYRNEKQYGDAFAQKLRENIINFEREKVLTESFPGEYVGRNRIDFLIENSVIIELKAIECLSKNEYFQCERYLVSCNLDLALLVNFRSKYLLIRRILNHQKYNKNNHNL